METTKKHKTELKVARKQDSENLQVNFLRRSDGPAKNIPENQYTKVMLDKKLSRVDKIFNFIEYSTMLSPFVSLLAVTVLHKLSDINDTFFVDSYVSNLISMILLPLSLTGVKKTKEKLKNRIIKKYNKKNNNN
jgi:hypothetical protein